MASVAFAGIVSAFDNHVSLEKRDLFSAGKKNSVDRRQMILMMMSGLLKVTMPKAMPRSKSPKPNWKKPMLSQSRNSSRLAMPRKERMNRYVRMPNPSH